MELQGSCRCGGVKFSVRSHTPYPYMLCYCSICRKTAGCGGYAINIMGQSETLKIHQGEELLQAYRAMMPGESGNALQPSSMSRMFCKDCGSFLWGRDPSWDQWIYPMASAIDTNLPEPPSRVHLMLGSKANWVTPQVGPDDETYDEYPKLGIEEWHKKHNLYIA